MSGIAGATAAMFIKDDLAHTLIRGLSTESSVAGTYTSGAKKGYDIDGGQKPW